MAVTCRKCKAKIFSHTALCDDRNDPNKEFGCPNCGQFLIKMKSELDRRRFYAIAPIPLFLNWFWKPQNDNLLNVYLFLFISLCLYNSLIELYAPIKLPYYRSKIKKNFS